MANYKATKEFTSKAGSYKPGDVFNTDKEHGDFLVSIGNAEFVSENEPRKVKEKKQLSDNPGADEK